MPTDLLNFKPGTEANVIELRLPETLDSSEFDKLNESLLKLLEGRGKQKWIIDLAAVSYMGCLSMCGSRSKRAEAGCCCAVFPNRC
jgi:hypothetical protein